MPPEMNRPVVAFHSCWRQAQGRCRRRSPPKRVHLRVNRIGDNQVGVCPVGDIGRCHCKGALCARQVVIERRRGKESVGVQVNGDCWNVLLKRICTRDRDVDLSIVVEVADND